MLSSEINQLFRNQTIHSMRTFEYQASPTEQNTSLKQPLIISDAQLIQLKELQGQCKIKEYQLLEINYTKAIFSVILMACTIFGLLLLKYYKKIRARCFYIALNQTQIQRATHIYVKSTDKIESNCKINSCIYDFRQRRIFTFKYLKYQFRNGQCIPLGFQFLDSIDQYRQQTFIKNGLNTEQHRIRSLFFGKNQHNVLVPNYFEYLFDIMTKPFFIFQYFVSFIYIMESVAIFGGLMIFFSFFTTSVNYILLYKSYGKIKETAEKRFSIIVLRNGKFQEIQNVDLVPGDLYVPKNQVPCDSIILRGDLFVDEASLTGENVPIAKIKLLQNTKILNSSHWIYEGSKIQTAKNNVLALAINTGFGSKRGRIIRKILTRIPKQPQFYKKMIYFLIQVMIISFCIYFATLNIMMSLNIQPIMVLFRFCDFITYSFPAAFPIFFNLNYSFCLVRLRRDEIYGTESEKTIEGSRLKTICFDKTGTLTINGMKISKIYNIKDSNTMQEITSKINNFSIISNIFAACNSVEMINNQYKGDQIDLRMFQCVKAQIKSAEQIDYLRKIEVNAKNLQIIHINQYESKFQSMSVLFKQIQSNKYYVAVKGSPEMIHQYSKIKFGNYDNFIKKLSLQGYRSIAIGIKQIAQNQLQRYTSADRELFLSNTSIVGVVTFVNQLKNDAKQTIQTLTDCGIATKIITGDNIYLGVQTALMTGMIKQNIKIVIIEGQKYNALSKSIEANILEQNFKGQIIQSVQSFVDFQFEDNHNIAYAVDNDFIKKRPEDFLHPRIKVFARITPQNKALIIKKHREIIIEAMKCRTCYEKVFGEGSLKVGMVGDGANDLIALKQADVGIGISSSDAVYSASFSIGQLQQIIQIVRQAKNTERQIIDMTQYYLISNFISIIQTVYLTTDYCYASSYHQMYKNFITTLILTLLFGLSRPAKKLTKYLPSSNFMGLENHLIFWITCILITIGYGVAYFWYKSSSDFSPNPTQYVTFDSGWTGVCKSGTMAFIIVQLLNIFICVIVFRSDPWKQPFYKNIPLSIVFLINVGLIFPISLNTPTFSFIDLVDIGRSQTGIVISIILGTLVLIFVINLIIQKCQLHKKHSYLDNEIILEVKGQSG